MSAPGLRATIGLNRVLRYGVLRSEVLRSCPSEPARVSRSAPLRRLGLGLFFVSVACNAVIAIYALLAPGFGETEGRVLATSLYVTAALLLVLACSPALERRLLWPVPLVASACGVVAFAILIGILWTAEPPETITKVAGTALTAGVAGTLASLLVLARPARRYRAVPAAAFVLTAVAAAMIVLGLWIEPDADIYGRALGAVLVALAALVVTIPVLHRLSVGEAEHAETPGVAGRREVGFCPGCGEPLPPGATPAFTCPACGRTFTVLAAAPHRVSADEERPLVTPR